jgi:hypothetical protein
VHEGSLDNEEKAKLTGIVAAMRKRSGQDTTGHQENEDRCRDRLLNRARPVLEEFHRELTKQGCAGEVTGPNEGTRHRLRFTLWRDQDKKKVPAGKLILWCNERGDIMAEMELGAAAPVSAGVIPDVQVRTAVMTFVEKALG